MNQPPSSSPSDNGSTHSRNLQEAYRRLAEFRRGQTEDRLFVHPIGHPSNPTGFCYCERSFLKGLGFHFKAILLSVVFRLPFNRLKWRRSARWGRKSAAGCSFPPEFGSIRRFPNC